MGRTSKKNEPVVLDEQSVVEQQDKQETQQSKEITQPEEVGQVKEPDEKEETEGTVADEEHEEEVKTPSHVTELMRLYPQYSEFWVTPRGFLHPKGMPEHLLKDAVLYKNKFFNK